MTAIKITKFIGTAPRNSPELLANTAAQVARNAKLYSGDLIPYPQPVVVANTKRTGAIQTLYGIKSGDHDSLRWLSFANKVDIVTPATDKLEEHRFYYTGDGVPKVSTYALATEGSAGPYPISYYDLGLPLPSTVPTTTVSPFTAVSGVTFKRDNANTVTLTTASAHNLKSGAIASITGFTYRTGTYSRTDTTITVTITGHGLTTGATVFLLFTSGGATTGSYAATVTGANTFTCTDLTSGATSGNVSWDIRDLNTITEVSVVNSTTITYFAAGSAIGLTNVTDTQSGAVTVDLGDQVQGRSYLYTWFTPWREESIGSEPTGPDFMREGQIVRLTNLPFQPPSDNTNIRGIRLYRTISSVTGSDYFLLKTLWFPAPIKEISRTSGVVRVVMQNYHNLLVDDRIKLTCANDPTFDITDAIVTKIIGSDTFEYEQVGYDFATATVTGTVYYDIAEKPTNDARYWGFNDDYSFTDDFDYRSLTEILASTEYEKPPENLQGLTALHNEIMAGFVGNDLYFSEPGEYHAWPSQYRRSFEYDIVALAAIGGILLVLTKGFPYIVEGNSPATMVPQKLAVMYPCLSANSVVQTSFGVVWATHDGLAVFNASSSQLLTKAVHHSDTWNDDITPSEIVGTVFKENYIGSARTSALTLEAVEGGESTGLSFVDLDFTFSAAWYDNDTNILYTVSGLNGDIYRWDDRSQPAMSSRWKSKVYVTASPMNLGAARVVADYDGQSDSPLWEEFDTAWNLSDTFWDGGAVLTFNLYINKQLIFTTERTDSGVFRLPAGYKSDTFEVEVISPIRVRSIHVAETPIGLAGV
jgi:hypothetical protein